MTVTIQQVAVANNTFLDFINKFNVSANVITTQAVTVNSNTAVGNAAISDTFSANTVYARNIVGGLIGNTQPITVSSNVAFASNVAWSGSNNSFGLIGNLHIPGANTTHRMVAANTTTNKMVFVSILSEMLLYDGAGSALDADLLDGEHGSYYANIAARQGYTSANKAGDTFTGNVAVANSTLSLSSSISNTSVTIKNNAGVLEILGTKTHRFDTIFNGSNSVHISSATSVLLLSFPKAQSRTAKITLSAVDNVANNFMGSELLIVHDGGNPYLTAYAVVETNSVFGTFSANANTTHINTYFVSTTANADTKFQYTLIDI